MAVPLSVIATGPQTAGLARTSAYLEFRSRGPGPVCASWIGYPGWSPRSLLLLPDGCADVVWDGTAITVVSPRPMAVRHRLSQRAATVGVRLRAGWAGHTLRTDIGSLPAVTDLAEVCDTGDISALTAALAGEHAPAAAARLLAQWVGTLAPAGSSPDPRLLRGIEVLRQPGSSVGTAAGAAGCSSRGLHRLFVTQVGLAPKPFQRVRRFQRFRCLVAGAGPALTLAEAAAACGYADQAHLAHDCRELSGRTPTALARAFAAGRQLAEGSDRIA